MVPRFYVYLFFIPHFFLPSTKIRIEMKEENEFRTFFFVAFLQFTFPLPILLFLLHFYCLRKIISCYSLQFLFFFILFIFKCWNSQLNRFSIVISQENVLEGKKWKRKSKICLIEFLCLVISIQNETFPFRFYCYCDFFFLAINDWDTIYIWSVLLYICEIGREYDDSIS